MQDIIFKMENFVFSYRIAGILIRDGKILLQKPLQDDGYSFPGGHVSFGETSDKTLVREFKEEIGADIKVGRLVMIGENFFPWGSKTCQQICLYYLVSLRDETQIPLEGSFKAFDELCNERTDLDFCWISLSQFHVIKLYPAGLKENILSLPENVKHFVYMEEAN
ncbi:MAG TPA: NUDIX hydrolase [Clostridia bacterium]|nr:NUDIX hydrolase [Clostridia bacterium]